MHYDITLLHTSPSYSAGTVLHTTHPDFSLHDAVEVSWPLTPITGTAVNVVLTHQQQRYLAEWVRELPTIINQLTYAIILTLPQKWKSPG